MPDPLEELRAADAVQAGPTERCDHICHLDADHLERGWCHQYGYENPSPRVDRARLDAAEAALEASEEHQRALNAYARAHFPTTGPARSHVDATMLAKADALAKWEATRE